MLLLGYRGYRNAKPRQVDRRFNWRGLIKSLRFNGR